LSLRLKTKEKKFIAKPQRRKEVHHRKHGEKKRDLRIHNINTEKIIIRKPGNQEIMNTNFILLLY